MPDIRVSMSASPADARVGDQVSFTVKVSNTGTADAAGVNVLDKFPPQLSDIKWTCTATTGTACAQPSGAGAIQMENLAMAKGSEITLIATALLRQLPATGSVSNQVAAQDSTGGEDADPADNFAQATVRVAGLVTTMTAAQASVGLGEKIAYTVQISNPGTAAYAGATVAVDLSDVVSEAVIADLKASDGSAVEFATPNLKWSGTVPARGSVDLTYTAKVNEKLTEGSDQRLAAAANSLGCLDLSQCATAVAVRTAKITRSAGSTTGKPGETITYTVHVANTGPVDYPAAAFTENLATVLDSATYNGDVSASAGAVSYGEPTLSWSGDLAVGATATVTYSLTVIDSREGDAMLTSTIMPAAGVTCESCASEVRIARLRQAISALPAGLEQLKAGDIVDYKVTVSNEGTAAFAGASYVNDIAEVLDDAVLTNDPKVTGGQISSTAPKLTWTGDVDPGGVVELTYSVTVQGAGDGILRNVVISPDTNCKVVEQKCLSTKETVTAAAAAQEEAPPVAAVDEEPATAQDLTVVDGSPVTGTPVWLMVSIGLAAIVVGLLMLIGIGRLTSPAPRD